ncbi:MAG: SHOCT domain-containing protein [Clostridiales bacterium]|nr:SHOCT domain-containing protein [Clostridiales bacterium]
MKNDSVKKFSIISTVCFIILAASAIYGIINYIDILHYNILHYNDYYSVFIVSIVNNVIQLVIWTAFAILLALQKKNNGLVIVSGANVLFAIYYIIIRSLSLVNILSFLCSAAILTIILFTCIPVMQEKGKIVSKLWFIPGALAAVTYLIQWIQGGSSVYIIIDIIEVVAYLMLGLWLVRSDEHYTGVQSVAVNECVTSEPQSINARETASFTVGDADRLKKCKELLDSGAITQEEFEAKKKEILGLQGDDIKENENVVVKETMQ